ncbi:MAG: DNA repair protein RecO [Methyloligellaceae bacterium]
MNWSDEGIVLSVRNHGETSAILELLTQSHGRHLGLVHGGRSRRLRPVLQPGNTVAADWRARLADHLGVYKVELLEAHASLAMQNKRALAGLTSMCAMAQLLPEHDVQTGLFLAQKLILEHLDDEEIWVKLLILWELELLSELGYRLDLAQCAATGATDELIYVSPKSGSAVCREAGQPYGDRLLNLPAFLHEEVRSEITSGDIMDGLHLTQFFLEKRIYEPQGLKLPEARLRLVSYLSQQH